MHISISSRDQRTLLLGVGVVGTLLAASKGIPIWRRWDDAQRANAEAYVRQVTMAREGVGLLSAMRDSLATRMVRVRGLQEQLVDAHSVPQAAATLASVLAATAAWAGLNVSTLSVRTDSVARDGFALVGVRVTAEGDVAGLTRYLRRVEVDSLLLAVRELTVSQPDPGAAPTQVETLHVDVLVEVLARIDTSHTPSRTDGPR